MSWSANEAIISLLNDENKAWVETLRILDLGKEEGPVRFLRALCALLYDSGRSDEGVSDKALAELVHDVYTYFKLRVPPRFRSLAMGDVDRDVFNEAVKSIREFFESPEKLVPKLQADLDKRYATCRRLATNITSIVNENAEMRRNIEKVRDEFLKRPPGKERDDVLAQIADLL